MVSVIGTYLWLGDASSSPWHRTGASVLCIRREAAVQLAAPIATTDSSRSFESAAYDHTGGPIPDERG